MSRINGIYLAASGVFLAGLLLFAGQLARMPARRARQVRRRSEVQQLLSLKESRQDLLAIANALDRLPESAPISLEQLAGGWLDPHPVINVETRQMPLTGWTLLRATVTFDNAPFEKVWAFLSKAGAADKSPPWRLVELALTPSAPGRGQAVLTLEALRRTARSPASQKVDP